MVLLSVIDFYLFIVVFVVYLAYIHMLMQVGHYGDGPEV